MNIRQLNSDAVIGTQLQHHIRGLCADEISARLGFAPSADDDDAPSWVFAVDGCRCAVWNAGGKAYAWWSAFGPRAVLIRVFGEHVRNPGE